MLKKILAVAAMLYAAACFAAVDVNKATAAELDSIKGIGPAMSTKILDERKKGSFKDWNDFVVRIKGVGEKNAAKFSSEGLTVDGSAFKGAPAAPAAAKKMDAKAEAPKPAASAAKK
jgi:competence protein ComEA